MQQQPFHVSAHWFILAMIQDVLNRRGEYMTTAKRIQLESRLMVMKEETIELYAD